MVITLEIEMARAHDLHRTVVVSARPFGPEGTSRVIQFVQEDQLSSATLLGACTAAMLPVVEGFISQHAELVAENGNVDERGHRYPQGVFPKGGAKPLRMANVQGETHG